MGRAASGIRAIRLKANDVVSSADLINKENKDGRLLVIMANGYGKQTKISEYKTQNRGGSGIRTAKVTAKTGPVVAAQLVTDQEELIAISANGQIIKTTVASVRATGRSTQGVKVMTLREKDKVAGMICL
jgi:DNA gyrase subunit A